MYRSTTEIPPRAREARQYARDLGFTRSCTDEVGRLLRVLAASARGTIAELGTGCGVGTSWLASALLPGASLVSVELDEEPHRCAAKVLAGVAGVELVHDDWRAVLDRGPFSLLFPDCPGTKELTAEIAASIAVGGVVVVDDLTPAGRPLPPERQGRDRDEVRESWLDAPGFVGTEVLVSPVSAALVLTRVR
jgi:predicted O-methyltransferase YrrM